MTTHSVFLPRKFHGQRSLAGYSLWGCKEPNMTGWLTHTVSHTHSIVQGSGDTTGSRNIKQIKSHDLS